jgi:hypothetical protein
MRRGGFCCFVKVRIYVVYASAHGSDPIVESGKNSLESPNGLAWTSKDTSVRDFFMWPLQDSLFSAMGLWRHSQNLRTNR